MIVTLNGYNLNDGISPANLDVEITGLDLPSIRTSSGNYAGRNGGYVGGQFYSARDISLQGQLFSSDIATLEAARQTFQTALASQNVTVRVLTNAGKAYVINAYLIDFDMPIDRSLFVAKFKIELLAPDPTIYDDTGGAALSVNVPRQTAGGYTYPVVYPVVYAPGSLPTTVPNGGTTSVYPVITLTGAMTNPVITNTTTGAFFGLLPLTTSAGDVVVIDMANRTVTLNGGNIFALQKAGSTWWSLLTGNNQVALTSDSGTDNFSANLSWRPGYLAI